MPNKRRFNKLKTKLLAQGKLNSSNNERVRSAVKYLADKAEIDQEDIDFEYDVEKNGDFEKIDDGGGDGKSTKKGTKRKQQPVKGKSGPVKKLKKEEVEFKKSLVCKSEANVIPKKSKKNKYFLVAHPEVLTSKKGEELLANESIKNKFVIDQEKIKLNSDKKKRQLAAAATAAETASNETSEQVKKKKKGSKLWVVEECSDESEDDNHKSTDFYHGQILDISDIDKSFKLKKVKERQPDGSFIHVLKPEYIQSADDDDQQQVLDNNNQDDDQNKSEEIVDEETELTTTDNKSSPDNLREKLTASRFRYLNELLYTQPSGKSFDYFKKDPDAFKAYHDGFQSQVVKWPINPLDEIIKYVRSKPAGQVVADFGCGEALLAKSVKNKHVVHSFDLVASNDLVTACDMKKVPLDGDTCDLAVFCLSLMGTNTVDFLCEAHRVLKSRGVLKIAEVVSRINNRDQFIRDVESIGFKLVSKRNHQVKEATTKDYFYFFDFVKTSSQVKKRPVIKLSPCLYKKR